jgi:hypothetical protein
MTDVQQIKFKNTFLSYMDMQWMNNFALRNTQEMEQCFQIFVQVLGRSIKFFMSDFEQITIEGVFNVQN